MTSYVKVSVTSLFCAKTVVIVLHIYRVLGNQNIFGCHSLFFTFFLLIGGKNCFEETKTINKIILKIWRNNTFLPKFEKLFNIRKL